MTIKFIYLDYIKSLKQDPYSGNGVNVSVIHYAFNPAISYGQSVYGLQTEGIVTSDMLTPYTLSYDDLPDPSINIQNLLLVGAIS